MNYEKRAKEIFSPLAEMDLSEEEKGDILETLRKSKSSGNPSRKLNMGVLASIAAGVAAVAIVAGGFGIEINKHHQVTVPSKQKTTASNQVQNKAASPTPSTTTNWHYVGTDDFLLQGKITAVDVNSQAIKLEIHGITPNGPLRVPTPKLPYPKGSVVTIYFKHLLPTKGTMKPVVGESVQVWVGQYTVGSSHVSFLGSNMAHGFYFDKNGKYFNAKGEQPAVLT